jgi:hypothetical protein
MQIESQLNVASPRNGSIDVLQFALEEKGWNFLTLFAFFTF